MTVVYPPLVSALGIAASGERRGQLRLPARGAWRATPTAGPALLPPGPLGLVRPYGGGWGLRMPNVTGRTQTWELACPMDSPDSALDCRGRPSLISSHFFRLPVPPTCLFAISPLTLPGPNPQQPPQLPFFSGPWPGEGSHCSGGPFLADALPTSSSSHSPLSPQVLTNKKGHYAAFKIPHSLSPNSVKPPPPLQQEPTKSLRGVQSSCVCPSKWLQSRLCSDFKIQETSAHTPSRPPRTDPKGAATPHPHPTLDPNTHWLSDLYSLNPDANPLNWPFRPHLPPHEAAHTVFSKEHYLI